MKIVLDTNVLVSGLLQPFGPSGQIVRLVASGEVVLCHDPRILTEYGEVLHYPVEARQGAEVLSPRAFIELIRE